jgi:AcrR family transcriptional regulator
VPPRRLDLRIAAAAVADGEPTMAEIARRLQIAKPTLYKLARSRSELVRACVETEAERLLGHLHAHERTGDGVLAAVDAYERDSPGGFRLLFERRPASSEEPMRRVETRLAEQMDGDVLRAAGRLGRAAAVVSRARADGLNALVHASTGCRKPPGDVPTGR